jgi:hypothetical protein
MRAIRRFWRRAVYRAVTSRRPKPRYPVNGGMQSRILDLLPRTVADRLVKLVVDSGSRAPRSAYVAST